MDAQTLALFVGLQKTIAKLTVTLVEQGVMDSRHAVRTLRDFANGLGYDPHDRAARLLVDHLVETLEADRSSARHLPTAVDAPVLPLKRRTVPGRVKCARADTAEAPPRVMLRSKIGDGYAGRRLRRVVVTNSRADDEMAALNRHVEEAIDRLQRRFEDKVETLQPGDTMAGLSNSA